MDAMTEMFYDESNHILREMRKILLECRNETFYNQEVVLEFFRSIHTLKADSTMMLYEELSSLSRRLESLLYCFRGEGKKIEEKKRFQNVIENYISFFEQELDKIAEGNEPDGVAEKLEEEIEDYVVEMKQKQGDEEKESEYHEKEPQNQVYYIAGVSNGKEKEKNSIPKKNIAVVQEQNISEEKTVEKNVLQSPKKRYMFSDNEREKLLISCAKLGRITDELAFQKEKNGEIIVSAEQLEQLFDIKRQIDYVKKKLTVTDFVPVAKKMEILVDEMSSELHKPVKLLVKGEDTLVEEEIREKISGALTHLIRNAVDHGIEDIEIRERYGKSPMGLIKLKFSTENGRLKISIKDDGAGIDTKKVLEKAKKLHLLTKQEDEYTEKEIIELILINGLTTTEKENGYSGRGVGMDVISHNVKELGGKLKISSEKGVGTTIVMKF